MSGLSWAIGGIAGLVTKLLNMFFPSNDRDLGRTETELEQRRGVDDAKKRMEDVEPSTSNDASKRLRNGDF